MKLRTRFIVQSVIWLSVMALLLFIPAGNWRWVQAWAFLAIFAVGSAGFGIWFMRRDPALLESRLGNIVQPGQPVWDRAFLLTFVLGWCAWLVLMALDAQAWHTSRLSPLLNVIGGALVIAGFLATTLVLGENSFAAPVVRVQGDRDQRVIDTGPYAIVRHPMYSAGLLYIAGMPLLLGSWYGLLAILVFVAGIVPRAILEERLLKRELPGYSEYARRVRYRFIPGVW